MADAATGALRTTLFISHAATEDNEFALWLSAKLLMAGYKVWVDVRKLLGGDDFWDDIECVLREEAIKQIVVFSKHSRKPGVKRELAIGAGVARKLQDDAFMIPIRVDDVGYDEASPEFIRSNILPGRPNWHYCLAPLLETLEKAKVPRTSGPDAETLRALVAAREQGRRFLVERPETLLTNWFSWTSPPARLRFYGFDGTQDQMRTWLRNCPVPHVPYLRLAASFADPAGFAMAGPFPTEITTDYDVAFEDFVSGKALGPVRRAEASNLVANLMRQHFDVLAGARGLKRFEFANGDTGWFFPEGLLPSGRMIFETPDGRKRWRTLTGRFKTLRWHMCLVAKPRIWPEPVYRVHANLVLTEDGQTALPGGKTHKRRRRLTRSWWNDIWRDRLLASMAWLAAGDTAVTLSAGNETMQIARFPITTEVPVSYYEAGPTLPDEESEEGEIILDHRLDGRDDLDESGDEL
jgi:hypothetical protein